MIDATLDVMSIGQREIHDATLPLHVEDPYVDTRETKMTSNEDGPEAATAGHRSADHPHDRIPIRVSIPRELPAWLRHVHIIGRPGSGKAVPLWQLVG